MFPQLAVLLLALMRNPWSLAHISSNMHRQTFFLNSLFINNDDNEFLYVQTFS